MRADQSSKVKVLFVCMGNICRSPTAHGVFRDLVIEAGLEGRIEFDSAGTHTDLWHKGAKADTRAIATASKYGCCTSDLTARQLTSEDFEAYDYLIAMDEQNVDDMLAISVDKQQMGKVSKLSDYVDNVRVGNVPDPYFNNQFDEVYLLIDTACRNFLNYLKEDVL